jgi:hypothetical protein
MLSMLRFAASTQRASYAHYVFLREDHLYVKHPNKRERCEEMEEDYEMRCQEMLR